MGWLEACEKEAKFVSQKKRQQFLDLIWDGKTMGEARESIEISLGAACGIVNQNIESKTHNFLRKKAL